MKVRSGFALSRSRPSSWTSLPSGANDVASRASPQDGALHSQFAAGPSAFVAWRTEGAYLSFLEPAVTVFLGVSLFAGSLLPQPAGEAVGVPGGAAGGFLPPLFPPL